MKNCSTAKPISTENNVTIIMAYQDVFNFAIFVLTVKIKIPSPQTVIFLY